MKRLLPIFIVLLVSLTIACGSDNSDEDNADTGNTGDDAADTADSGGQEGDQQTGDTADSGDADDSGDTASAPVVVARLSADQMTVTGLDSEHIQIDQISALSGSDYVKEHAAKEFLFSGTITVDDETLEIPSQNSPDTSGYTFLLNYVDKEISDGDDADNDDYHNISGDFVVAQLVHHTDTGTKFIVHMMRDVNVLSDNTAFDLEDENPQTDISLLMSRENASDFCLLGLDYEGTGMIHEWNDEGNGTITVSSEEITLYHPAFTPEGDESNIGGIDICEL